MTWSYSETNRAGDHIWWVSDIRRFATHYPGWALTYSLERTIEEIHTEMTERAGSAKGP
jgi:CDP-paratose 2-epimerase